MNRLTPLAPPARERSGVIMPIQYLRGIAALMVVWHHARIQIAGAQAIFPSEAGTAGVDLFFVISGFIMVVTTAGSSMSPWQFIRRRIIRVVPLYWSLTLLMVALALLVPSLFRTLKVAPATLLQSLLFIPHFSQSFPDFAWPLLVPGWTLNYEMFFYAVFAATLLLPALRERLATMTIVFGVLVGIGLAFGPFTSAWAQTYTNPALLEFIAGTLVGAWWVRGERRLPLVASMACLLGGTGLLVRYIEPMGTYTPMVGALLIVIGALDATWRTWVSGIGLALGDASYSIYLTHLFTLGLIRAAWTKLLPATAPTLTTAITFMAISLLVCALVGWLCNRLIETPLMRLLGGLGRRKSMPAPVAG